MVRCPGQDERFWKPDDIFEIQCSGCGRAMEFFKDEPKLKCRNCGQMVVNPKIDLGCAEWCQYAEQCLGVSVGKTTVGIMRDKLIDEMKKVFAGDEKRIKHTLDVLSYAERIQQTEGGDPLIVKAAAILHDIGIHEAERKYNSSAGKYQEIEGPIIAREILARYNLDRETVGHICKIIANHHSARDIDTIEFRIVWDADWLVNIPADFPDKEKDALQKLIDKIFKTQRGHQIAVELFLVTKTKNN
ncbi:MAG: HD domain-containing protein [Deltaproteobacteria bacterium]|nr:HD domain-containing protein [Deltaproteobacteria bacterium]